MSPAFCLRNLFEEKCHSLIEKPIDGERQGERDRETERQREREGERENGRERERERERECMSLRGVLSSRGGRCCIAPHHLVAAVKGRNGNGNGNRPRLGREGEREQGGGGGVDGHRRRRRRNPFILLSSQALSSQLCRALGSDQTETETESETETETDVEARYVSTIEETSSSTQDSLETVPPFTFKELLMLKALARFGSIKAAAEYLYVSQSSVSSQLASLEQKIKATLVNRHPGIQGASFTEEGQLLLRYAERILTASAEAIKALDDLKNLEVGGVNLGATQTTGTYLIPRLVGEFQQKHPGVRVQLTVGSTSSICHEVADGDIDVAIVGGEVPTVVMDQLQVTTYTDEEFVLILPPRHPLTMQPEIEKEKLYNLGFVSLNQNSTSQKFQTQTLKDNGINTKLLHIQMEFNSIEAIKSAVQHGLGAAFVSQSAIQKEVQLGLLHSSSIQDVILTRKLQVVTNSKRYFSRAAQCFTQEILTAADWYGIQQSENKSNRIR